MSAALATLALLLLFAGASALADRLAPRRRAWPVLALAVLLALVFVEWTRWDLGRPDAWAALALVVAPVTVIFGGSLWGSRRFYGWPDLGPVPGRAALVGLGILAGVLVGHGLREQDVEASLARARRLARDVVRWHDAHEAWPASLEAMGVEAPPSRMGTVDPPPLRYEPGEGAPRIVFAVSSAREVVLDVPGGTVTTRSR